MRHATQTEFVSGVRGRRVEKSINHLDRKIEQYGRSRSITRQHHMIPFWFLLVSPERERCTNSAGDERQSASDRKPQTVTVTEALECANQANCLVSQVALSLNERFRAEKGEDSVVARFDRLIDGHFFRSAVSAAIFGFIALCSFSLAFRSGSRRRESDSGRRWARSIGHG